MNNPILTISDLHKSFGQNHVLQGIHFAADRGNVIALLGSSGSGKSTLLRCINLLETANNGNMQLAEYQLHFSSDLRGRPIPPNSNKITQIRQHVGMVFQQFNLWAHMTILQNLIEAPIHVLKKSKAEAIAAAEDLLNKVGIINKKDCYPSQLSGGQQQRAAIARALMMKPAIMLFDEPTSALDPEMVGEVLKVMQELAQQGGMTMLVATHEIGFAREVASHVMFLEKGKLLEFGPAKELFAHPKTERFQQFLASVRH